MSRFDREWNMLIDGELTVGGDADKQEVVDPATGRGFTEAPVGTAADVDQAVASARTAFADWRWTDPVERADLLYQAANRVERHLEEIAHVMTLETGKPISQSRREASRAAACFRFHAGGTDKFYGDTVRSTPESVYKKVFEPYGVVASIIPWNWPSLHAAQAVAPQLATGNTVVVKTAPQAPLAPLRIAELISDLFPDGIVNVVSGSDEAGRALSSHGAIDMLAFTGSDQTGEKILESASKHVTPTMLELGGKNAEIVFPDADFEKAVTGSICNAFNNSGQACSNTERLLLHSDIADRFLAELQSQVEDLTVGEGISKGTQVGPLIDDAQRKKVESHVKRAESDGAEIVARADTPTDPDLTNGYWVAPTVFSNVDEEMEIAREEVFGPIVSVMTFDDEREAVRIANDVEYGLTAVVWTTDLNRAHRLATRLEAGTIAVNNRVTARHALPFGGYKRSGIGRKSDFTETVREFTRTKSVHIDLTNDRFSL